MLDDIDQDLDEARAKIEAAWAALERVLDARDGDVDSARGLCWTGWSGSRPAWRGWSGRWREGLG